MTTTDLPPVLQPAPEDGAPADLSAWLERLIDAVDELVPTSLVLPIPFEQTIVEYRFELTTRDGGTDELYYRLTEPVTIPAHGPGGKYPARTVPAGEASIDGYWTHLGSLPRAVLDRLEDGLLEARDADPALGRTLAAFELRRKARLVLRTGRGCGPGASDVVDEQLTLVPLVAARDAEHARVLHALVDQDWTGTIPELLDAAEAILTR